MSSLPEIDDFYTTFFDRWYTDDDRDRKRFKFTRPDIMKLYKPGVSVSEICALNDEYRDEAERRVLRMFSSAKSDWPTFCPFLNQRMKPGFNHSMITTPAKLLLT